MAIQRAFTVWVKGRFQKPVSGFITDFSTPHKSTSMPASPRKISQGTQRSTPIGKNIHRQMKATHRKVSLPPKVTFTDRVWCLTNILLSSWLTLYRAIDKNELKTS
ncbi:28S ribosomal protein S18a, mitochondrial [Platysternon megacephalum]|uniref:28S ribosomal protein S18a, mitochondrial n=1 Tax=Platysternon megacephalum TaxID=55544 RepID=A0A4D9EEX6_9SAUR|nr:28S ribosomal protein S18a, mitochondrial [Platysternon megacephalum]